MAFEVLLVQVLVLGFTAALWWIARRDLAARVLPPAPSPSTDSSSTDSSSTDSSSTDTAELEQLCATLETVVTSLARRLDAVERAAASEPFSERSLGPSAPPPLFQPAPDLPSVPADPLPDPRYEPVYALLASGVADPVEIARQTGLGRGEVDLILSLRDRRAL